MYCSYESGLCVCVWGDADREALINTGFVSCRDSDIELPSAFSILHASSLPLADEQMSEPGPAQQAVQFDPQSPFTIKTLQLNLFWLETQGNGGDLVSQAPLPLRFLCFPFYSLLFAAILILTTNSRSCLNHHFLFSYFCSFFLFICIFREFIQSLRGFSFFYANLGETLCSREPAALNGSLCWNGQEMTDKWVNNSRATLHMDSIRTHYSF